MSAWYNEIDPYAAQWLRNLISAGHIAPGEVDERSVEDVAPADIRGFRQCHFFAGIGIWSLALRNAGWPDDRPVWTGSCPCQPFSVSGKGGGFADERHLWPAWHHLIRVCRPDIIFGEQVASSDGLVWLDLVSADMEGTGYALGAFDLCAAGIGAPHIRQRLWFVGMPDAARERWDGREDTSGAPRRDGAEDDGAIRRVAHTDDTGPQGRGKRGHSADQRPVGSNGMAGRMADADSWQRDRLADSERRQCDRSQARRFEGHGKSERRGKDGRPGPVNGFWADADWILCRDPDGPRWRPVEPGTFPLAHGVASRVGRLRAYGNGIVAPLAQTFIESVMECMP